MNRIRNYFNRFFADILVVRWPIVEQWIFLLFCASLVFLSLTGFFFALFISRGLHGYFLLLHVAAGGIFALTLTILVVLRVRFFSPMDIREAGSISGRQKNNVTVKPLQAVAAWLVVVTGLYQLISSLLLMMPLFSTETNRNITALHRWIGLVALLAALFYAYLSLVDSRGAKK